MVRRPDVYDDWNAYNWYGDRKRFFEDFSPDGYRWVDPRRENFTKDEYPYSYSEYYIWGEPKKGDNAAYSDRLSQWSAEKWERAWAAVKTKNFQDMSPKVANKFMSAYEGKPMVVTAIAEGCNQSSGYPYWILWFHKKTEKKHAE